VIVVVGGQSRKTGKTRAVCDIIAATREAQWTAVKVSPHEHDTTRAGDSQRYLDAGAKAACLIAAGDPLPAAENLIVESNSVMERLRPDLFVFVTDPEQFEWKDSSQACGRPCRCCGSGTRHRGTYPAHPGRGQRIATVGPGRLSTSPTRMTIGT
jgi:hypothetical protein